MFVAARTTTTRDTFFMEQLFPSRFWRALFYNISFSWFFCSLRCLWFMNEKHWYILLMFFLCIFFSLLFHQRHLGEMLMRFPLSKHLSTSYVYKQTNYMHIIFKNKSTQWMETEANGEAKGMEKEICATNEWEKIMNNKNQKEEEKEANEWKIWWKIIPQTKLE